MPHDLVSRFYEELWNLRALHLASEILDHNVTFKSSTGTHHKGIDEVCEYINRIHTAFDGYTCQIQRCIANDSEASALVEFQGRHVGEILNHPPTGKTISWIGAAFFTFHQNKIQDIWVLSDLQDLHKQLSSS